MSTTMAFVPATKPIWITGRKYYQEELFSLGVTGPTEGLLVRESDNTHDTNALRIDINGVKIGYLPRGKAADISPYMDGQDITQFRCSLTIITPGPDRALWAAQFLGVYRDAV